MHRFYLPPAKSQGPTLLLEDREAHHGATVLRLQRGERVTVLTGAGVEIVCEIAETRRKQIELREVERKTQARPPFSMTLIQAIVKGKTMETIIQKATELGVTRIIPLQSDRVVARLDEERGETRQSKWQAIAIEAIKQCGAVWLPEIGAPVMPRVFLERRDPLDIQLVASLQGDGRHARVWFEEFAARNPEPPRSVSVWIGPEGDFTDAELAMLRDSGARPITLGQLVLRADTAAIFSLSVIRSELEWRHGIGSGP